MTPKLLRILLTGGLLLLAVSCTQQNIIMFDEDYEQDESYFSAPAGRKAPEPAREDPPERKEDSAAVSNPGTSSPPRFTYDERRIDDHWPVFKVATMEYFPPFVIRDELRIPSGFDVELLTAIGRAERFNLVFIPQSWKTAFDNLDNESRHIVVSGVAPTASLKDKYDFSDGYFETGFGALVDVTDFPKTEKYQSLEDLLADRGVKFAVLKGTASHDRLRELLNGDNSRIVAVDNQYDEFKSLLQGKVTAIFNNMGVLNFYKKREYVEKQRVLKIHADPEREKVSMSFVVKKGNSNLVRLINSGLKKVEANGEYDRLKRKWFND